MTGGRRRAPWWPAALVVVHLAAAAALIALDWPANLTDEDDYMPHALDDVLHLQNPYTTVHAGGRTFDTPQGPLTYAWETMYPYLPALAVLQVPLIDYRWTAWLAYGALLTALRDRPLGLVAFANPFVMRLAASGFNDFVVLALLAWGVRGRRPWPVWVAAGAKQLAFPVVLLHHGLRREWRQLGLGLLVTGFILLPFVLWDPAAFWHAAVAQHVGGPSTKLPGLAHHVNYFLYPLFALTVTVPEALGPRSRPARPPAPTLDDPRIAVVLPALDEEAVVGGVVRGFAAQGARVVVVDNGSRDDTAVVARAHGAEVVHEPHRGYGSACLAGLRHLEADPPDVVVVADCDGTLDASDLPRLVAPIARGEADLTLGRRAHLEPGALPPHQRAGNAVAALLLRLLHGVPVRDVPPYRAVRWDLVGPMRLREPTYGLPVETIVRAAAVGGEVREVDVAYRRRGGGTSKVAGTLGGSLRAAFVMFSLVLRMKGGSAS